MGKPHHFIREWMDYFRVNQAYMIKEAGWSKATASQIYNGTQDYSPKINNEAAAVFNIEPYELLLPPERALALRQLRQSAIQIVHSNPDLSPALPPAIWQEITNAK